MPKIPRDCSGERLAKILGKYGYKVVRQTGSHIRLFSLYKGREHHLTIPNHNPIKIGTLNHILNDIADLWQFQNKSLFKNYLENRSELVVSKECAISGEGERIMTAS